MTVERPPEIESKARDIIQRGFVFEIELLSTGHISMTVENRLTETVLAHEICPNGPAVPVSVDKLVNDAFEHLPKPEPIEQ